MFSDIHSSVTLTNYIILMVQIFKCSDTYPLYTYAVSNTWKIWHNEQENDEQDFLQYFLVCSVRKFCEHVINIFHHNINIKVIINV